jgi:putative glutamine amidotransferase
MDDYIASVEEAGARVRVLEVSDSSRKLVGEIDGLLLTGGGDVDPVFYREPRHSSCEDAEPGRDEFEIDLVRRAIDADLPVLAICRGAQVLNVAAGGTLIQDIPSAVSSTLPHQIRQPRDAVAHEVQIASGSRLEQALGPVVGASQTCRVNSRHHQSVAQLGDGLVSSAVAPDGVIEAIEKPEASFCVGVQWHPENFCRTGEFSPLFRAFVEAARARLVSRTGELENGRRNHQEDER